MLPEQRRRRILEYLEDHGAADVPGLVRELDVSSATVRRDLQLLEQRGHVTRTHGGAVLNRISTAFEPLYRDKTQERWTEKKAIGALAAELVNDGEVVVLDSGSTTLALARELKAKRGLTIITTDLHIALELSDVPRFEVIIVGGIVRPGLFSVVGPDAERALGDLHANRAFLGADAIDLAAGVTNASMAEVAVKRHVIASAARPVLLADHSKFDKVSLVRIADLAAFDQVITDTRLDGEIRSRYAAAGTELSLAKVES